MAIHTRKNASALTPAERDRFLEALVRMKSRIVPGRTFSVYDQFVALHSAVFAINTPGETSPVNMGHSNIGFLPWHREYLWRFERALQVEVPGVTLPYWAWPDSANTTRLFVNAFIGPSRFTASSPGAITGFFSGSVPAPRPSWWPSTSFAWRIRSELQGGAGAALRRGSVFDAFPATAEQITTLEKSDNRPGGVNPYWFFCESIESAARMHNAGHNAIGGHMATGTSPNDPIFWMHHAYIDRVWARWQANRRAAETGSTFQTHYPLPTEASPFGAGRRPPNGHRRDDMMWPWVGSTPGYSPSASATVRAMLIDYSGETPRQIKNTFDTRNFTAADGYEYS